MPKDRFNEFLNKAKFSDDDGTEVSIRTPFKPKKSISTPDPFDDFFKEVDAIKEEISSHRLKAEEINKLQSSILSTPHLDENARNALNDKTNEIRLLSLKINNQLKVLDQKVKEEESAGGDQTKKDGEKPPRARVRMMRLQHSTLMNKFKDATADYSKFQEKHHELSKKRIERTLQIANKDMTEQEIANVLEKGNIQIFAEHYLESTAKAKLDLQELEERHQDLTKLEKSIEEMKNLFIELSILIEHQGETIDRIEDNVQETKDYVEASVKQTEKALVSRKKSNKKRLCIVGCVLIAVLLLALFITIAVIFR